LTPNFHNSALAQTATLAYNHFNTKNEFCQSLHAGSSLKVVLLMGLRKSVVGAGWFRGVHSLFLCDGWMVC
jgi:hypothetical protein